MKSGFLGGGAPKKALTQPVGTRLEPAGSLQGAQPVSNETSRPLELPAEQWSKNFEQCLQLLAGPADETRFVGLLLAAKLLPQGGDAALKRVFDAVGWQFIQRLLLPLGNTSTTRNSSMSSEAAQQQAMCAGVGLSVLSALCRLPEVADSSNLHQCLPSLLHVIQAGSISAALRQNTTSVPMQTDISDRTPETDPSTTDYSQVEAALECLLASCSSTEPQGVVSCQKLRELNTLPIIAGVLSNLLKTAPIHQWQAKQLGVANAWRLPVLAVRLIGLLVSNPDKTFLTLAGSSDMLVPVLCHFLGLPEVLSAGTTAAAVTAARKQAQQEQEKQLQQQLQQQAGADDTQQQHEQEDSGLPPLSIDQQGTADMETEPTQHANTSSSDSIRQASTQPAHEEDAALLQLESLQDLLLLLQQYGTLDAAHPIVTAELLACSSDVSSGFPAGWGSAAHRGLSWVLRSRVGVAQRHAALQACAELCTLLGPSWLIQAPAGEQPDMLLNVLSETLQVELGLLLRDALHGNGSTGATTEPVPSKSAHLTATPTDTVLLSAQSRATELLPAVMSLLESLVEVLSQQAAAEDEDMESGQPETQITTHTILSGASLQRLMMSLSATIHLVVQFFQSIMDAINPSSNRDVSTTEPAATKPSKPAGTTGLFHSPLAQQLATGNAQDTAMAVQIQLPQPELLLACTRLVGRYIAEAPNAVDTSLLGVLPIMLLHEPTLQQCAQKVSSDTYHVTVELQDLAMDFLLPGLIQVLASNEHLQAVGGPANAQELTRSIVSCQATLNSMCSYMSRAAREACHEASQHGKMDEHAGQQVFLSEKRLADICALLLAVLGPVSSDGLTTAQTATARALVSALPDLAVWSARASPLLQQEVQSQELMQEAMFVMKQMADNTLMPRTLLCVAAVAAAVLSVVSHTSGGLPRETGPAEDCIVALSNLISVAVEAGFILSVAVIVEENYPARLFTGVGLTEEYQHKLQLLLSDFQGDAESAWESLLLLTVVCLPQHPALLTALRSQNLQRLQQHRLDPNLASLLHSVASANVAWRLLLSHV